MPLGSTLLQNNVTGGIGLPGNETEWDQLARALCAEDFS